jgi:hypothetical protein
VPAKRHEPSKRKHEGTLRKDNQHSHIATPSDGVHRPCADAVAVVVVGRVGSCGSPEQVEISRCRHGFGKLRVQIDTLRVIAVHSVLPVPVPLPRRDAFQDVDHGLAELHRLSVGGGRRLPVIQCRPWRWTWAWPSFAAAFGFSRNLLLQLPPGACIEVRQDVRFDPPRCLGKGCTRQPPQNTPRRHRESSRPAMQLRRHHRFGQRHHGLAAIAVRAGILPASPAIPAYRGPARRQCDAR